MKNTYAAKQISISSLKSLFYVFFKYFFVLRLLWNVRTLQQIHIIIGLFDMKIWVIINSMKKMYRKTYGKTYEVENKNETW